MQIAGNNFLILVVLTFLAVVLALESGYLVWRSRHGAVARKVRARLRWMATGADESPEAQVLKARLAAEEAPLERLVLRLPGARALDRLLVQAGLPWTVGRLLLIAATAGALALAVGSALLRPSWALVLAGTAAATLAPFGYVARRRSERLRRMEQQLPDALDLMGRALRAGHAFSSALQMAGEESPPPLGAEFRTIHDEINFGFSLQQALVNLTERVPSTDVRYFVVAVLVQRESGGNLTEILGNLSRLVRERLKLMARVRVLSSEGRLSAWILCILPFALGGALAALNPGFMSRLWTDPIGITLIKYMLVMMLLGVLMLRRIVRIRV